MCREIKNKDARNTAIIITKMSENKPARKQNDKVEYSWVKAKNNQPLIHNMNIPSDLNNIQPISTYV